jgi:hypothetical protein
MELGTMIFILEIFGLVVIAAFTILSVVYVGNWLDGVIGRMKNRSQIETRYDGQVFEAECALRSAERREELARKGRLLPTYAEIIDA